MKAPAPVRTDRPCRALLEELFAYLDQELTPERCRELETHLASCHCCGTLAGNLRKAVTLCRMEGAQQLPGAVRANARRRMKQLLDSPPPARRTGTRRAPAGRPTSRATRKTSR